MALKINIDPKNRFIRFKEILNKEKIFTTSARRSSWAWNPGHSNGTTAASISCLRLGEIDSFRERSADSAWREAWAWALSKIKGKKWLNILQSDNLTNMKVLICFIFEFFIPDEKLGKHNNSLTSVLSQISDSRQDAARCIINSW